MNNVMSEDVILKLYGKNEDCKEIHLKEGKEYELTIRAMYYGLDDLDLGLSFISELSGITINVDDIINIEEVE